MLIWFDSSGTALLNQDVISEEVQWDSSGIEEFALALPCVAYIPVVRLCLGSEVSRLISEEVRWDSSGLVLLLARCVSEEFPADSSENAVHLLAIHRETRRLCCLLLRQYNSFSEIISI